MKKAKVFGTEANGTWTEVKAYKKENAVKRLQQIDASVKSKNVVRTNSINSHQAPVEDIYDEFK